MKLLTAVIFLITASLNIFTQSGNIPQNLLNEYYSVKKTENSEKKTQIALEMEKYMNTTILIDGGNSVTTTLNKNNSSSSGDWYSTDVITYSGNLSEHTKKPLVLKQGEDGLLYLLVALKPQFSQKGVFRVYKSSNGGVNWIQILESAHYTEYFLSLDMLVESRSNSIADSTRITVFYTSSTDVNGTNAKLNMYSFRRNGDGLSQGIIGYPASGKKYEQVTCTSDGQYYQNSTYLHAIVKESLNGGATSGFRHFRTVNWGQTYTNELIVTDTGETNPMAQFLATSTNDSIYICFERVFDIYSTGAGIFRTPELPSAFKSTVFTPFLVNGIKNEKPCLTISQQNPASEKNMIFTYSRSGKPESYYSTNSGKLWNFKVFAFTTSCSYTFCTSDSSSASGNNFVVGYVTANGDSIMSTRISITGFLLSFTRLNNTPSSPNYMPVFTTFNDGSNKYSVSAFAGSGGVNAYFDGEHMITGIHQINTEIPSGYSLEQNYPNPFNPVTNIKFSIPKAGLVTLKIYDIAGREVAQLVNQNLNAGTFNNDFDASHLSTGAYFYRLSTDGFTDVKKMILIK